MKGIARMVGLLFLVLMLGACSSGGGSSVEQYEINAVIDKALDAFRAGHEDMLGSILTTNVKLIETVGNLEASITGRDEVVAGLMTLRSGIETIHALSIHDRKITRSSNTAVVTGTFFLDATYYSFGQNPRETTSEPWRIGILRSNDQWLIYELERTLN